MNSTALRATYFGWQHVLGQVLVLLNGNEPNRRVVSAPASDCTEVPHTVHRVGLPRYRAVDLEHRRRPSGVGHPLFVDILGERARRIAIGPYTTTVRIKFWGDWTTPSPGRV